MSSDSENDEERSEEYLQELQQQVLVILNQVKEEMGVDTLVDIEVREAFDDGRSK